MGIPQGQQLQTGNLSGVEDHRASSVFDHAMPRQTPGVLVQTFRWSDGTQSILALAAVQRRLILMRHLLTISRCTCRSTMAIFFARNWHLFIRSDDKTLHVADRLVPETRTNMHHDYPWTHAHVGNDWFYNHPAIGLVKYDGLAIHGRLFVRC